ncbi:MAG: radical SAM protein [Candidatus Thorarchaeota archaeon]
MSKKNSFISINLSEKIPYKLEIKERNTLQLTKGIIVGTIPLDSLILELVNFLKIESSNIIFSTNENDDIYVHINHQITNTTNEIVELLLQTISFELPHTLKNKDTKKPLTYVTEELIGFPLIGSFYIGIIDRGTNLLQVRSITGCPLNCPFCSVDEGPASSTKLRDFIVDPDYLVQSYDYVVKEKGLKKAEAHLDGQGEPMSYPYLLELIQKISENNSTNIISLQTNGWYLNDEIITDLAEVGLTRINLSLNSLDLTKAKKLSGRGDYPLERIMNFASTIIDSGISLLIAPLWISQVNDEDIEEIIKFIAKISPKVNRFPILGIQNYLTHSEGRNIKGLKSLTFSEFNQKLKSFEEKYAVKDLLLKQEMFETQKTKMIANPFHKNEITFAEIIFPGRIEKEVIAKAKNRLIHITNAFTANIGKTVKIKITRNKHNIFFGEIL